MILVCLFNVARCVLMNHVEQWLSFFTQCYVCSLSEVNQCSVFERNSNFRFYMS